MCTGKKKIGDFDTNKYCKCKTAIYFIVQEYRCSNNHLLARFIQYLMNFTIYIKSFTYESCFFN